MISEIKKMNENTPAGRISDADTILADTMQNADFEVTGLGIDVMNIWLNSKDKESVERLFYDLTDCDFSDYLHKCLNNITRS